MSRGRPAPLVVIGAGPGGYAAAFLAADLGMSVTLVDPEAHPGGVCLYRGCIPSKALLHVARTIHEAHQAADWGVTFGEPRIDLARLVAWKRQVVDKLTGGLGQLSARRGIDYVQGRARFRDARTLVIETGWGAERALGFEHAIVATGSLPAGLPELAGSGRVMDSTAALELEDVPARLLVVGGGYIGLELGSVYSALGSRVTVVEMTDALLPGVDADLVRPLAARLKRQLAAVLLGTRVVRAEERSDGVAVTLVGAKDKDEKTTAAEHVFDRVLVAVGRRPNTDDLGLENTRVRLDERHFIVTDEQCRTDEPSIWAIGDVAGSPMLAHKASHEARVAVEAIAGKETVFAPAAIPAVVFTDPEIAWCGLTETEARRVGKSVEIARFPWAASGRAATLGRDDGLTKLVVEPDTERILGVGLCGPGAGELIAEGVLAVEMGAVVTDLKLTIHPHPTLSETVMEAAHVFFGESAHTLRPRKGAPQGDPIARD